jgi:hypothetical protein
MNIDLTSTQYLFISYHGKFWFFQNVLISYKWTQCIRFFNEIHYILLTHFNLLEYNYIVVSPLNKFCELHIFMWKGVQIFHNNIIVFTTTNKMFFNCNNIFSHEQRNIDHIWQTFLFQLKYYHFDVPIHGSSLQLSMGLPWYNI